MVVGAGAAVTGAGVGLTVMDTELLAAGVAAGVAAFGGYSAVRSKVAINQLRPPPDPPVIMPASVPLPPAAPGAAAAARITVARSQIMELLPTVEYLQAEAAGQVLAADAAAAPATHAVVERIRAMHRIVAEMAGSPAAQAAALSLPVLEQRLAEGAAAYHELLAAVIGLASAPDLHGSIGQSLRPAINELQAYTAGLERAAQTWG
jgi:hypothetical protein